MKQFLICISLFCYLSKPSAQPKPIIDFKECLSRIDYSYPYSVNDFVKTPFGLANNRNVHYVDSNHRLIVDGKNINLAHKVSGKVSKVLPSNTNNRIFKTRENKFPESDGDSKIKEVKQDYGWITYAYCESVYGLTNPYSDFSASWKVPSPPLRYSNQLIYLFISMDGVSFNDNDTVIHIIQPVLQWGKSPAGGGDYWSICNWHVTNTLQYFHDSLIRVDPGTILKGTIKLISENGGRYAYKSSFEGFETSLEVSNLPELNTPSIVLEAYNINSCDEYPDDEKLRVNSINIMAGDAYPKLIWHTSGDFENPVNDCNQYTEVIDESSQNGVTHIFFHTPTSIDGYNDMHIFPNPVKEYLNISPNESFINCKIEVINSNGKLLHSTFIKYFDYEIDIDFEHYAPGLYFVKISYFKSKYALKESNHTFKVLKSK